MSLRKLALVALSTAFIAGPAIGLATAATTEPATPPAAGADPATPAAPGAPPPTLPGEATPAAPAVPAAPARTAADTDAELTKTFGESAAFKTFLTDLQTAISAEDKKAVAEMIAYPFKTKVGGAEKTFAKEADFVKAYDDVMAANIVKAVRDQKYEQLTVTPAGVGVGSGQLWFTKSGTGDKAAIKIIAINQQAGA